MSGEIRHQELGSEDEWEGISASNSPEPSIYANSDTEGNMRSSNEVGRRRDFWAVLDEPDETQEDRRRSASGNIRGAEDRGTSAGPSRTQDTRHAPPRFQMEGTSSTTTTSTWVSPAHMRQIQGIESQNRDPGRYLQPPPPRTQAVRGQRNSSPAAASGEGQRERILMEVTHEDAMRVAAYLQHAHAPYCNDLGHINWQIFALRHPKRSVKAWRYWYCRKKDLVMSKMAETVVNDPTQWWGWIEPREQFASVLLPGP